MKIEYLKDDTTHDSMHLSGAVPAYCCIRHRGFSITQFDPDNLFYNNLVSLLYCTIAHSWKPVKLIGNHIHFYATGNFYLKATVGRKNICIQADIYLDKP